MIDVDAHKQGMLDLLDRARSYLVDGQVKGFAMLWVYEDGACGKAYNVSRLSQIEAIGAAACMQDYLMRQADE